MKEEMSVNFLEFRHTSVNHYKEIQLIGLFEISQENHRLVCVKQAKKTNWFCFFLLFFWTEFPPSAKVTAAAAPAVSASSGSGYVCVSCVSGMTVWFYI